MFPTLMARFTTLTFAATILFVFFTVMGSQAQAPQSPKLQISASNRITEPFIAAEKDIRKLREILEKRASEVCPHSPITFRISFSENTSYETRDLDTILKEQNRPPQTITYISMETDTFQCRKDLDGTSKIGVEISHKSFNQGLSYSISGNSRDWVYLTQSDISQQLESMVVSYVLPPFVWGLILSVLFVAVILFAITNLLYRSYCKSVANNPDSKPMPLRNYLIHDEAIVTLIAMAGLISFMVGYGFSFRITDYLWPSAVFLIGDEIKRNEGISYYRQGAATFIVMSVVLPSVLKWLRRHFRQFRLRKS